jgi:hypothetical protein
MGLGPRVPSAHPVIRPYYPAGLARKRERAHPSRYPPTMPKRSSKRPRDLNSLAASLVEDATDEAQEPESESQQARAGRSGGLKGGKARAERLAPQERSKIARKAARARWSRSTG